MEGVFIKAFVLITLFLQVEGRATVQCAQVGQSRSSDFNRKDNVYTIGGEALRPKVPEVLDWYPRTIDTDGPSITKFWFQHMHTIYPNWQKKTCPQGYYYNSAYGDGTQTLGRGVVTDPYTEECSDRVDIKVNLVRQRGITLKGWLYIEVMLTKKAEELKPQRADEANKREDSMELIYVQVRDENFDAIGEFVSDPKEQCPVTKKNENLIRPTEYQMMPCSATGAHEAKTSQAIFMGKKAKFQGKALNYLPEKDLHRGIGFMWRLNEYWCNRHMMFRIDAFVWTSRNDASHSRYSLCHSVTSLPDTQVYTTLDAWRKLPLCRSYQKKTDWFQPLWFGASDIITPGEDLDCTLSAYEKGYHNTKLVTNQGQNWLYKDIRPLTIWDDYVVNPKNFLKNKDVFDTTAYFAYGLTHTDYYIVGKMAHIRTCQVNPIVDYRRKVDSAKDIETFGGRCAVGDIKTPSHTTIYHTCKKDFTKSDQEKNNNTNFSSWENYNAYYQGLTDGRLKYCDPKHECVHPTTDEDLKEIMSYPREEKKNQTQTSTNVKVHVAERFLTVRIASRDTIFWHIRKYHASLCVFFTMFIMPVCLVISRYFKETFMSAKGTLPVWVWSHIFMSISVLTLFRSSFTAMREHIYTWGRQDEFHSNCHRGFGYFFVGLFSLMICLGIFRPLEKTARHVICTLHSVIGFVLYLIALILIMTSPSIPGSPSVDKCLAADPGNETSKEEISHKITGYAAGWLVFDIIFHVSLTLYQFVLDKRLSVNRTGYGLPFIPFLPYTSLQDFPGSLFRKIALGIYTAVAFIMTMVVMVDMFDKDLESPEFENCKPRNLTCDVLKNPFGCSYINQLYFDIVKKRYNLTEKDFLPV